LGEVMLTLKLNRGSSFDYLFNKLAMLKRRSTVTEADVEAPLPGYND
jgi:hypothetical protein